jgi:hypothetical protein
VADKVVIRVTNVAELLDPLENRCVEGEILVD